jgi:hypothetical protein
MTNAAKTMEIAGTVLSQVMNKKIEREWVDLTDEDIGDVYVLWNNTDGASFADFARAIETRLKERNEN